jgi:hypothetical protein
VKKKRFSVVQIVAVFKQVELGMPVADATRQFGVSEESSIAGSSSTRDCGPRKCENWVSSGRRTRG